MIDFISGKIIKLHAFNADTPRFKDYMATVLLKDEHTELVLRTMRDRLVLTNYRMLAINKKGFFGIRKVLVTIPYVNVQAFHVEYPGWFSWTCHVYIWVAGMGKTCFQLSAFSRPTIRMFHNILSQTVTTKKEIDKTNFPWRQRPNPRRQVS